MRKKTTTMKKASESRRSSRSKRAKPKAGRRTEKAAPAKRGATKRTTQDVPQFFRLNIEVGNLDTAAGFYAKLLGLAGRKQAGSRVYFTCGPVTLQVVDVSSESDPHPAAKALYFTVRDLDALYERARALGCLSKETVHEIGRAHV